MRLKVLDSNGVEQIIEAQSIVLADGSFLDGTGGAPYVVTQSGSVNAYGAPGHTLNPDFDDTAADTSDGTTVFESPVDLTGYNHIDLSTLEGAGADTVQIYIMHKGQTVYESTPIQLIDRSVAVGNAAQSVDDIKTLGNYYVSGIKLTQFKVVQNGASITTAYRVRGSYGVV